jgi:hypothetical protein
MLGLFTMPRNFRDKKPSRSGRRDRGSCNDLLVLQESSVIGDIRYDQEHLFVAWRSHESPIVGFTDVPNKNVRTLVSRFEEIAPAVQYPSVIISLI